MTPLSLRLREATAPLHRATERAGPMPALLRGELPVAAYGALLRELEPLYAALEAGLARPGAPRLDPRLWRHAALRADLAALGLAADGPRLAPTRAYVAHLRALDPPLLAAHAYVRYLGDLAGGQVLARLARRHWGLGDAGTSFYAFDGDPAALAQGLRAVLDALPPALGPAVLDEACAAFRRHVDLFEALGQALRDAAAPGR